MRFGYVWTGKFDLNLLRVDGKILNSERKKLRIEKKKKKKKNIWMSVDGASAEDEFLVHN